MASVRTLRTALRALTLRAERSRPARLVLRHVPAGALTLASLALAGYAMGLARDKVLAHTFGAGADLDAYNAAFILPELALDVLVAGGLVAPFVPLFLGLRDEAVADADRFARTVLGLAGGAMVAASAALFALAPATVALIVPGFTPENQDLYVGLFRVMCLTPPIFAASLVVGEVLVAERRFLWYGLAPLMYSGGIAAGALLLSGEMGVYGAAWGAVAGAVLHLAARLVGLRGTPYRARPGFALRTRGLAEFVRLMLPKMASQPLDPLVYLYYTSLASGLAAGSVSSLNYARNFYGVPVSLIGMSFAIAAFPALSDAANAGDREGFARTFRRTLISVAALSAIAGAALLVISDLAIGTLLGGGAFDAEDVSRTALALSVFALAVPLESLVNLMARAVYATRDTLLPTLAALAGFVAVVLSSQAMLPALGIAAIPASYAAGMGVRAMLLLAVLAVRAAGVGRPAAEPRMAGVHGMPAGRPPARRRGGLRPVVLPLASAVLLVATAYAAAQALSSASIAAAPVVTPWAQEYPSASHDVPPLPTPSATPSGAPGPASASPPAPGLSPSPPASPSPSPMPTPTPGPFSMDLYQKGDFVGEYKDVWCVPAAMQTSINIMSAGADTSKAFQTRIFNLAYAIAPGNTGGTDMAAWPKGLTRLGFGGYALGARSSMADAVKAVARAIRLTNRPGGLIVWYGWHSWVVSGFTATADPALTDAFTVTGLYIEDVWYNRHSSIWGWSNPPDTLVRVADLSADYKRYREWTPDPTRDGKYVFVVPVP